MAEKCCAGTWYPVYWLLATGKGSRSLLHYRAHVVVPCNSRDIPYGFPERRSQCIIIIEVYGMDLWRFLYFVYMTCGNVQCESWE